MRKFVRMAVVAAVVLAVPFSALAVPISGDIKFSGNEMLTGGTDFLSATGIHFMPSLTASTGGIGDYASIAFGTPTTFQDFTFSPTMTPSPVAPLWMLTDAGKTYSFEMSSVTVLEHTNVTLSLGGIGTLRITGFEDTFGTWNFTTQRNNNQTVIPGQTTLVFSSNSTATRPSAVPEPGTLLLLGAGLLGLGLVRRKRD